MEMNDNNGCDWTALAILLALICMLVLINLWLK